ncbi:AAA family ATPase [Mycolicibacterium elephantis]|uniref:AAA+ ATPase domain-containing protein n=1 Tax=Mycolicibacterium elephantis DSM 44368 TaxID=1335622 RepID=A0A439DXW8_9MYCO|nr:AAA family ATPase [Mycolicibacterium elephantis]MCV7222959.1 AAA family ATPase [Mycolicibacterium elephantis]RWA22325.1 hypothetical protein MELE44368_13000 [Mycolicibacterium elephantis DSM 44368]
MTEYKGPLDKHGIPSNIEERFRYFGLLPQKDTRTFLQRIQDRQRMPESAAVLLDDAYVAAAHRAEIEQLSRCPNGQRNHTLNVAALKLARLPIDRDMLRSDLINACHANNLVHDDGIRSVEATINSAFTKADHDGPRDLPDRHDNVQEVSAFSCGHEKDADEIIGIDLHERKIEIELEQLRIRDEARRRFANEQKPAVIYPTGVTLGELLAQPDEDAAYRIEGLLPTGGRVLLAAQFKAGKTTLVANLARALADGTPFLNRFTTTPGRVVLIDDEMDPRQLWRQLRDQGVNNVNNVTVFNLRGRVHTFDLLDADTRAWWADQLRGVDVLIVDCLRPLLDSLGLDESHDAGRFLIALDQLLDEAEISEAILVHHMGHVGERSRGDSRLLDWPDAIWKIVREDETPEADRYFSAYGRDVHIHEGKLDYTHATRSLIYLDTSRNESAGRAALPDIADILTAGDGLSFRSLQDGLVSRGHPRKTAREAIRVAIADRMVYTTAGPRNATLHHLNPSSVPECAASVPAQ